VKRTFVRRRFGALVAELPGLDNVHVLQQARVTGVRHLLEGEPCHPQGRHFPAPTHSRNHFHVLGVTLVREQMKAHEEELAGADLLV